MTESTGGQTPSNEPRGGQTSAEAGGSIRDRLRAPLDSDEANSGGDSRGSDVDENGFHNTDSRAELLARGGDEEQRVGGGGPGRPYELRETELTAAQERSAERMVAAMFVSSFLATVGFIVTFFFVPYKYGDEYQYFTPLLATFMAIALTGIGAGAVKWAKSLMGDSEVVQERHSLAADPADLEETGRALVAGLQDTGLGRRKLLTGTLLLGAGSLMLLPLPFLLDLGPYAHKERAKRQTAWKKGVRLVRINGSPVRFGDLQIGSLESVYPEVPGGDRIADSPAMLIRMQPEELRPRAGREDWSIEGHIAYSVICTHLGCPVKLYEQQTHNLFCPCHQSIFDASNGAKVMFGPAARPLPQLAISVDEDGYFVAQGDFSEPVGPSYWERP